MSLRASLPPMVKLWFLDETPSDLWEKCGMYLQKYRSGFFSTEVEDREIKESATKAMTAKLIWQSNILEDTISKELKETETLSKLKIYLEEGKNSQEEENLLQLIQHLEAFKLLTSHISEDLTEDYIKEAHKIMMKGLQNEQGIPINNGEYRQVSVYSGCHIYPDHDCIPQAMTRIVKEYNQRVSGDHDIYELASWLHFEVVSLHPFEDGNGRISRLLWCYSLMKDGLPFPPVLTSGHERSQRHLIKCLTRDRDCFRSRHPHMTTLTVVSVSIGWNEFLSNFTDHKSM